jgi:hypothetical protein
MYAKSATKKPKIKCNRRVSDYIRYKINYSHKKPVASIKTKTSNKTKCKKS